MKRARESIIQGTFDDFQKKLLRFGDNDKVPLSNEVFGVYAKRWYLSPNRSFFQSAKLFSNTSEPCNDPVAFGTEPQD
ncbi:MAG: hypothetical protein CM15mP49_09580 [Actinomycetota bacterium]|nr:MAG: hypothetical protein CM15mP49_09580 [Actinomycetota bacterium]